MVFRENFEFLNLSDLGAISGYSLQVLARFALCGLSVSIRGAGIVKVRVPCVKVRVLTNLKPVSSITNNGGSHSALS
jgi:hypothetical protein